METSDRINGIPTRPLGNTGARVTILGLGGFHVGTIEDDNEAIALVRRAIDEGINFMDNAGCYHDGRSELLMGRALRGGYRGRVFLMTKNHGRDAKTFRRQLTESLARLQTDYIDLLQFHEIVDEGVPQRIASEGALEEALKARDEGKIRFIGFTGHRWPHLLREMLDLDFAWDTIQMPTNLLDGHFRSFAREVLPIAVANGIGVIGMKGLAACKIMQTGITVEEALTYALSLPIATLVSGIDQMDYLEENLLIAREWHPLTAEEKRRLEEQTAPWAGDGALEPYKTEW